MTPILMRPSTTRVARRGRLAQAPGLVLLCATLGACDLAFSGFREEARDVWTKTYPVSANGRVEVMNTNGFIKVEAGSGSEVEVHAEKVARAATIEAAKELLPKIEIREDITPDRIRLETKRPPGGVFGRGGAEVRYTLRVPATVHVELQSTNGQVSVVGVTGGARMTTTNGGIDGRALAGEVQAQSTNGGIDLELAALGGPLRAETTNGGVNIAIPSSAQADVQVDVTNGGIDVANLDLEIQGERTRRRVAGRLNGGGARIDVRTTNGGVTIRGK